MHCIMAGRYGKLGREHTFGGGWIARAVIATDVPGPCIQPPEVPKTMPRIYAVRLTVASIRRHRFFTGKEHCHD